MRVLLLIFILLGAMMASTLPKHYTKTLKNGLEIIVIPLDNGTNVVTTDIFYRVGSGDEIMGKSGIAHMLEHLNFKSTKNLKAGEFDEIVKGFGGLNNASTGFDYTHYFIKSSSQNMPKSLHLFAELMQNLQLKDEEFQPERDVVAEERRWRTDNNPMGYLYFKLFNIAYVYNSYHWTPIGFMGDIENWTIEDIKDFHSTYYQPKNAIVVVSGDIKVDDVYKAVEKEFAHIGNSKQIPTAHTVEPEQDGARRVEVHKESEVEMVAISYPIPDFTHEDQVNLTALSEILSAGKSSRLYSSLIDEKRLANSAYAYAMDLKNPGVFVFMAVCNPGVKAEDVESEILSQIERLKNGDISTDEIKKFKTNAKADMIFGFESSSSLANLFGSYAAKGDLAPLLEYEDNIQKVTKKELINVAKRYFTKAKSTTVILRKELI
jgi:predicted Zn-dependent peptidase